MWKFLDFESERGGSDCWPNNKIIDRWRNVFIHGPGLLAAETLHDQHSNVLPTASPAKNLSPKICIVPNPSSNKNNSCQYYPRSVKEFGSTMSIKGHRQIQIHSKSPTSVFHSIATSPPSRRPESPVKGEAVPWLHHGQLSVSSHAMMSRARRHAACRARKISLARESGLAHSSKDPPMAAEPGAIAAEYAASAGLRLAAAGKLGAGVPQQP